MDWTHRAAIALASVLAGVLHYDIWANHGYRAAPVRELFVLQAVAAVAAGALALLPRTVAAAPAVAVSAASLIAFLLSRTVGVPTLHGSFEEGGLQPSDASIAGISTTLLVLLAEAVVVAAGASILLRRAPR
jgi:hypothetical protein